MPDHDAGANGATPPPTGGTAQDPLPEITSSADRWHLLVHQLVAKIGQLHAGCAAAGVPDGLSAQLERIGTTLDSFVDGGSGDVGAVGVIMKSHLKLQQALTAAHARLGKAYGLGRGLADTRRLSSGANIEEFEALFGARVITIDEALADLASSLPEHSSRAVSLSLAAWEQWAADPKFNDQPVPFPNAAVWVTLRRQGELWRTLLMGEKLGKDMLGSNDYIEAAKTLFRRMVRSRPWLWGIILAAALAVAFGVYFLITAEDAVKAISGAALSILGAVGISAASLKRSLGAFGDELAAQVWGAELDLAIAEAITFEPGPWGVNLKKIYVPSRGGAPRIARNATRLWELRKAIGASIGREKKARAFLHSECRLVDGAKQIADTGDAVAAWLVGQTALANPEKELVPGSQGKLVSDESNGQKPGRFFVWTFENGKLSEVAVAADRDDAWARAGVAKVV